MSKKIMISVAVAAIVLLGVGIYGFREQLFPSTTTPKVSENSMNQVDTTSTTYKEYSALKGDAYDRLFTANMIAHHQGAVDMAKLAQKNAKHQELKDMADAIISAQNSEITLMQSWQNKWGYPSSSATNMMDHSAMGMMGEMSDMSMGLEGKTGDDFDKAFIEQMTLHHQSAIDMAAPGLTNAKHQEVKDLVAEIMEAQTKEITQMQEWKMQWGYSS